MQRYLFKGVRTECDDSWQTVIPSYVYTGLGNALLGLGVRDFNGLPKLLNRELLERVPTLAARGGYELREIALCFQSRRLGVSRWGSKRLRSYAHEIKDLVALRYAQRS